MVEAQVVAMGTSKVTNRLFNVAIAADHPTACVGPPLGRLIAQSTFHHFVDYNWDISKDGPSFVEEPPGNGMVDCPKR